MNKFKIKFLYQWIFGPFFDLTFILSPAFLSICLVLYLNEELKQINEIPTWAWVILILLIDVSHVYSTLFRSYFHEKEWEENKTLFTLVPIFCFILGVIVHSMSSVLFWSLLAYLAVFHFIRQQYGFLRIYTREDSDSSFSRKIDAFMIYISMLYPIVYWHTHLPRNFQWFMQGDFLSGLPIVCSDLFSLLYLISIILYLFKEIRILIVRRIFHVTKNILILGTGLSWYIGIVLMNNDGAFTITNVITHGIPYIALIWGYGNKTLKRENDFLVIGKIHYHSFFKISTLPLFLIVLFFFGYLEEGLWAGLVWHEHLEVFPFFDRLDHLNQKDTLSLVVPFLTLPQMTHYVLDGFIWKLKDEKAYWNRLFFKNKSV